MSFRIELEPCVPPIWARTSHAQTIFAHLLPSREQPGAGERFDLNLEDGDVLAATVHRGDSPFVVALFHGLGGSCQSGYIRRTTEIALRLGHTVVTVNHRGCGYGRGLSRGPHHSGRGEDLSHVIGDLRERFPTKKILAVGFSLGANALLTLLTGLRGTHKPDFAVAVNGPTDLAAASRRLQEGWNRVYDAHFVQMCRREIYFMRDQGLIEFPERISRRAHLYDIDRCFTAPYGGFASAEDYYSQCSTFAHFHKIKTPTVILMSKDDPFIPWEPYLGALNQTHIDLHLQEYGGHMGYLARARNPLGYRRWLDEALERILHRAPDFV
ncbi:MAG TPA: alpha/beta fold hydrolase [Bdellovibrionota bacterium]|jgi:predicted alpha/beta-fold hydrolase|nr:alpha/beta fold hydrolase [Bdellovibrionota bacterium]